MNLSAPFVRRPVATTLLTIGVALAGLTAYFRLPVSPLPQGQLYDAAATILEQKLSQVPGVGDVTVGGSSLPAVRAELNPTALFKYGIGLEDVRAALSAANANSPKGALENEKQRWQIYSN